MSDIIRHMTAGRGQSFVCWKEVGHQFKQKPTNTVLGEALTVQSNEDVKVDIWYSCAKYTPGGGRTSGSAIGANGFWFDLDLGDGHDKYPSLAVAIPELKRFCQETGLPKPSIIFSGHGLHVYWLIDSFVESEPWVDLASRLKQTLKSHGIKADPTRTADIASILRVPNTYNHKKDEPSLVQELNVEEPIELARFSSCLEELETRSKSILEGAHNSNLLLSQEFPPSDAERVADYCAQLGKLRETKGCVSEPVWYAGIGVLNHTENGAHLIHEWSAGHPDYDSFETDQKIWQLQSKQIGPTTCERFEYLDPDTCEGCPLKGTITSPIQIGTTTEPMVAPTPEPTPEPVDTRIPECARSTHQVGIHWLVGKDGVIKQDKSGESFAILDEPIYIERIGRLGYQDSLAIVHWKSLAGVWHTSEMSLTVLGDDKAMRTWLLSHAIASYRKVADVRDYLKDYVRQLNKNADPDLICQRFGWDGMQHFMVGNSRVSSKEAAPVRVDPKLPKDMREYLVSNGDLETWTEATEIFNKPEYWQHAFALLASFAAPIFNLVNISGAVLSLAGESGAAKTTASSFGLSVWGHPKALTASPQGTLNSKGELLRAANNLPLLVDDVSSYNRMLSALVYMAANGKAKERVSRSGNVYGQEEWQTVMMLTTNSPVLDLPEAMLGEAERRRVLEFQMNTPMASEDAIRLNEVMQEHHGQAGIEFIKALISEREEIIDNFKELYKEMTADPDIPEANRFGIWLIAAAHLAGDLAHRMGLIEFRPEYITQQALDTIKRAARGVRSPEELVDEAINAFLNENLNSISEIEKRTWVRVPDREAVGIIHRCQGTISIPNHRLKRLMVDWNIPASYLDRWAQTHISDNSKRLRLTPSGGREYCSVIKLPEDPVEED